MTSKNPVPDKDLPPRFRTNQYAASVAARINETFMAIAEQAPQLLSFERADEERVQIKVTLTDLTPIDSQNALFTVLATGGKYPLSYAFQAVTDKDAEFHIRPLNRDYINNRLDHEGIDGYSLDSMGDGEPEVLAHELTMNYAGDLANMGYGDIPDQRTVEARMARLLPS